MNPNAATSPLHRPAIMNAINFPAGSTPSPPFAYHERWPIALIGPPGVGAIMIARRLTWLMESLADIERTWLTAEYEAVGMPFQGGRPFRAPHHTISAAGLVGARQSVHLLSCPAVGEYRAGGPCDCQRERIVRPGELQLARFGVLYLDELIEFRHSAIESLVYEWRHMAAGRPWIVASVLSCPCGRRGTERECSCSASVLAAWDKRTRDYLKLLGIDRDDPERAIELKPFTRAELDELSSYKPPSISLADICDRVEADE